MSQVLTANGIRETKKFGFINFQYLPAIFAIGGGFVMLGLRLQIGANFISDSALMMLALACYILAALFQLTNLYAPSQMAEKIGLWTATLGVFFNLSSWLVRWVGAYDPGDFELKGKRKRRYAVDVSLYSHLPIYMI
jgi:L-lactate permease